MNPCDPLDDPSYLVPTVEIIAGAVAIHDLIDAYATFANRLRSHAARLDAAHILPPALAPLRNHKDNFVRALRRDIGLAHIDPFSRPRFSADDTSLAINVAAKQHARDSSSLCHHALCALTTVFRFPAFHSLFLDHDLSLLLGDVLRLASTPRLPALNEAKTYSLSLWALSCHRLPAAVLGSRQDDLLSALQRTLDGTRHSHSIVVDGLKAISHTIKHQSGIVDLLSPLLPHITASMQCDSSELRFHASMALGRFAHALVHQTDLSLAKWRNLSSHITSVLESWCDESQVASGNSNFSHIVRAAFSAESDACPQSAAVWILAILASWIVLCGPTLYSTSTVLPFILETLAVSLTHKRSIVRALHPHVWRCFVWTLSQMLLSSEDVDPALISSAVRVIKQEVRGGIGIALVNILLSDRVSLIRRSDRVSQALSVIKAMVRTECKHTAQEGFVLLQALTNHPRLERQIQQDVYEFPASVLLSGAVISAARDNLPSVIHSIPKIPVSVRPLDETEIVGHYRTLLVIWKHFVIKAVRNEWSPDPVEVWLSILDGYSRRLECDPRAITAAEELRYTAATIVECLPPLATGDVQSDWGSWDVYDQLRSLTFIYHLWSAMQKAFVAFSLADAAELILASILKHNFHVLDPSVRTLWSKLCASLMATVSRSFLHDMPDPTVSQLVIHNQRELWGVVATSLSSSELDLDWKRLITFLTTPICAWVLSVAELEAWGALLRNAMKLSGDPATLTEFILQYFQGTEVETWDSSMAVLTLLLTCIHELGSYPTDELLSVVDVCLSVYYNRARHSPSALAHSLQLLNVIHHVIVSAPSKAVHVLQALCSSLCLWIEDRAEVMSDDEFNSAAGSLYCGALEALESLPLSIQTLQDTEVFLASAFSRIPSPAIAPFAFEKFWRATYHGDSQFCNILPAKVKSCLASFAAAYGGDLADGLFPGTESQSQSICDGSQVSFTGDHRNRVSDESGRRISPSLTSVNAEAPQEADGEDMMHGRQQTFTGGQEDTAFLVAEDDEDNDALQPTVLRQLQEYTSRMDWSFQETPEGCTSNHRILSSPAFPGRRATPNVSSPEKLSSVVLHVPSRKRKHADDDDASQKWSRASRDTLRSLRKLESEPGTRNVTPIHLPRTGSIPPKKRMLFDGVHVPTLREVSRWKRAHNEHGRVPSAPSSPGCIQRKTTSSPDLPPSDEDDLDWDDFRVGPTSSEADIDQSLVVVDPSSSLLDQTSALHGTPEHDRDRALTDLDLMSEPNGEPKPLLEPSLLRAMSHHESSSSARARPSLRRAKTTSARLDALRDVYSSVANGASQISMSELIQVTRLVHQIGAVLTEQMGKKMGDPT